MAKLYATLEAGKGKTVSVSDNERITATVYDGNLKAYSVTIEWCNVGDLEHYQCQNCGHEQGGEGFTNEHPSECEECHRTGFSLIKGEMGAVVTTYEWRNKEENDRRKAQPEL